MLDGLQIFDSLSASELQELALFCQKKTILEGEYLFSLGDEANSLYIVLSGAIKVLDKQDKVLATVSGGDILGEMAILGGENSRTASAIASEDSELITILGMSIEKLAESNEEIFTKIQKIITERRQENIDI